MRFQGYATQRWISKHGVCVFVCRHKCKRWRKNTFRPLAAVGQLDSDSTASVYKCKICVLVVCLCVSSTSRFVFSICLNPFHSLRARRVHTLDSIRISRFDAPSVRCTSLYSVSLCDISYPFSFSCAEFNAYKMEKLLSLWVSSVTGEHRIEHAICSLRPCCCVAHVYGERLEIPTRAPVYVCMCVCVWVGLWA